MNLRELRDRFKRSVLHEYDSREADQVFYIALEDEFGMNKTGYLINEKQDVGEDMARRMMQIAEELATGKPVQYITGHAYFDGRLYKVTQDVLIPRPETEELVRLIAEEEGEDARFVDIGSGSGCIQIALSLRLPGSRSLGVDVSARALEVARTNAHVAGVEDRCTFQILDILNQNLAESLPEWLTSADFIVSNPPYISPEEKNTMPDRVTKYEPEMALFASDPLQFYRVILSQACHILSDSGHLYLELHENHAKRVAEAAQAYFVRVDLHRDLQGKPRMLVAAEARM